jgi:hypothetical protein
MALISCISLFFLQTRETRRARPHARLAQQKARRGMPPGRWRSFGEYLFLEDSRYTSQAENRAAVKSINAQRKSAFPVGRNKRSALRQPCLAELIAVSNSAAQRDKSFAIVEVLQCPAARRPGSAGRTLEYHEESTADYDDPRRDDRARDGRR